MACDGFSFIMVLALGLDKGFSPVSILFLSFLALGGSVGPEKGLSPV